MLPALAPWVLLSQEEEEEEGEGKGRRGEDKEEQGGGGGRGGGDDCLVFHPPVSSSHQLHRESPGAGFLPMQPSVRAGNDSSLAGSMTPAVQRQQYVPAEFWPPRAGG